MKADGGLRDALSIFDQMVSFEQGKVTYDGVLKNLNILDYDYYFKISDYILEKNINKVLLTLGDVMNNGFDEHQFIMGLAAHFRDVLVAKDASTVQLLEVGENIKNKYLEQSQKFEQQFLLDALEVCSNYDVEYKASKNKRLLTEIALMRLCSENLSDSKKKSITT
jgi:DNA polymerase-3 subunit gamma/tau